MMTAIEITSDAFGPGERIPGEYTCKGANVSPSLSFGAFPSGTQSAVVLCDDPDAPSGLFTHWILYNIPKDTGMIRKGVPKKPVLPDGSRHGTNSYGRMEYSGPCPPPGKSHHYRFEVYALDTLLALRAPVSRKEIGHAMENHILGKGTLPGIFSRGYTRRGGDVASLPKKGWEFWHLPNGLQLRQYKRSDEWEAVRDAHLHTGRDPTAWYDPRGDGNICRRVLLGR